MRLFVFGLGYSAMAYVRLVQGAAEWIGGTTRGVEKVAELRAQGIDAVLEEHSLDAILTPGSSGANLASRAGYPIVAVPFGMVPNEPTPPLPDGFNARPMPYGVTFTGAACSEPRLIALAYAFEQASRKRVPPPDMP